MKNTKDKKHKDRRNARRATFEELQEAAYYRWKGRGSPIGDELTDWLGAEKRDAEDVEDEWDGEEKRWNEENPQDEEPGEVP